MTSTEKQRLTSVSSVVKIFGYQLKAEQVKPFMVGLSNQERLSRSPFDRLGANG